MASFEAVSLSEEDGVAGVVTTDASEAGRFKRGKIIVVAMLLVGSAIGFSSIRSPVGVAADTASLQSFYSALKSLDIDPENINTKHLNTSGMPKDALRRLQAYQRRLKMPYDTRELASASCAVDVTQGTYFLERAALAITAATATCRGGGSAHVQAACAADIAGVYSSFAFVAEYISEAVAQCKVGRDLQAECSAGISGVVGNAGRIAVQAATMAGTCSLGAAFDKPLGDSVWQMTRRLQGANFVSPTYDERGMEIATCATDIPQAATYLAMFGIAIDRASRNCDRVDRKKLPSKTEKVTCAAGIMDVLESLFMASSFISSGLSHCAPITNQQALCASGAVGLAGGVTGLTKNALEIESRCKD